MRIHKEGYWHILISFFLIGGLSALSIWGFSALNLSILGYLLASAGLVLFILIVRFFRNPERLIHTNDRQILAPCDGKVVVIEQVEENVYFKQKMWQVSIFMSPLNVHVTRNPIGGKVQFYKYFPGKFLVAFHPKSSTENEHTFVVTSNSLMQVGYKQIAGAVARRICCYLAIGQEVKQGEEFGFIKFGSRMDIFIPLTCAIQVKLGDLPIGGQTILAEMSNEIKK